MTIEISESHITQAVLDICRAHTASDLELTLVEKVLPDDWGRNHFPIYDRPVSKDQFEGNFGWFHRMLPQFDIAASPELEQEAQTIIARLRDPNAPRAYTRGDVCPSNIAYHNRQMRFYDFEMGAFRHVFLSAVYFRTSHLSCFSIHASNLIYERA